MNCSGDGSYAEGRAHEAMLMAANWQLPIVFWCENNRCPNTPTKPTSFPATDLGPRPGYGIPAYVVDGQDLFACGEAALKAIEHARTARGRSSSNASRSAAKNTALAASTKRARARAPRTYGRLEEISIRPKLASPQAFDRGWRATKRMIAEIWAETAKEPADIEDFCEQSPKATPPIEDLVRAVYAAYAPRNDRMADFRELTPRGDPEAYREEMRARRQCLHAGHQHPGGHIPAYHGAVEEFGPAALSTLPWPNPAMIGWAFGSALEGMRPVVDFMYAGFAYYAVRKSFCRRAISISCTAATLPVPMMMVGTCGLGPRVANETRHSPIRRAHPSSRHQGVHAFDPVRRQGTDEVGHTRQQSRLLPVAHRNLCAQRARARTEDYLVPLGLADVKRQGRDVTVLTSGLQVHITSAVAAVAEGEIEVEVIDARSFEPFDLDTLLTFH